MRKLAELSKLYAGTLTDDEVHAAFVAIVAKARKGARAEFRTALDEFEAELARARGEAVDEAGEAAPPAADGAGEGGGEAGAGEAAAGRPRKEARGKKAPSRQRRSRKVEEEDEDEEDALGSRCMHAAEAVSVVPPLHHLTGRRRRWWRCDRSSYKRSLFSMIRGGRAVPHFHNG